ncbi:hypothetical protein DAPPUDRAFT_263433 [Daphnia pulex]|uniref:Uncharacterized protein n=1 Tax=Daphnia pulex TaxID=6669 RepID=E9HPR6_DAPPU|nr:hypothetical protein DAPPUDRAFT_263433 [Daphnia pulex]|eukprot:EFX66264.1 hypothetical protein DAPPUDRAFT_263433 [Daphnia pulex]
MIYNKTNSENPSLYLKVFHFKICTLYYKIALSPPEALQISTNFEVENFECLAYRQRNHRLVAHPSAAFHNRLQTTLINVPRMGNQVDEQILRLYLDVKEPSNKILPELTSQFPFLNLALHSLKERRNDFQLGKRKIWKQLRESMRDDQVDNQRPQADRSDASLFTLQCLTHVVESQTTLPTPLISKKSKTILKETKEIFLTYTRRIADIQLGQYLSLRTLEEYVPSPPAEFLGFVKRTDIVHRDESGDYHEFLLHQIEYMFDFLHESFDTFQKIFLENTQTLIQFLKKLHKIQSIYNSAGIRTPSIPTQQFPKNQLDVRQRRGPDDTANPAGIIQTTEQGKDRLISTPSAKQPHPVKYTIRQSKTTLATTSSTSTNANYTIAASYTIEVNYTIDANYTVEVNYTIYANYTIEVNNTIDANYTTDVDYERTGGENDS